MAGKKPRSRANRRLEKNHEAGTVVEMIQPLVHSEHGTLGFNAPCFSMVYLHMAGAACDTAEQVFQKLLDQSPVGASNMRIFRWQTNPDLFQFLNAGYALVLYSYLAVEAYTMEQFMYAYRRGQVDKEDWSWIPVMDRLTRHLPELLECPKPKSDLVAKYGELGEVRDNIMHPKPSNIYGTDRDWTNVPLAWLLSEKRAICLDAAVGLIGHFRPYEEALTAKSEKPGVLKVKRGVEYSYPSRKTGADRNQAMPTNEIAFIEDIAGQTQEG